VCVKAEWLWLREDAFIPLEGSDHVEDPPEQGYYIPSTDLCSLNLYNE
jgi:hypothetical protein